jgi:hypothetical protein
MRTYTFLLKNAYVRIRRTAGGKQVGLEEDLSKADTPTFRSHLIPHGEGNGYLENKSRLYCAHRVKYTRTNLVNALASRPWVINDETVEQVGYDGDNPVARYARVM